VANKIVSALREKLQERHLERPTITSGAGDSRRPSDDEVGLWAPNPFFAPSAVSGMVSASSFDALYDLMAKAEVIDHRAYRFETVTRVSLSTAMQVVTRGMCSTNYDGADCS
jgi:hypothetical protein